MKKLTTQASIIALLPAITGIAVAAAAQPPAGFAGNVTSHEAFAGVWRIAHPIFSVRTAGGEEPPLRPAAAAVYRQHQAARKSGDLSFDSASWCASLGIPRLLFVDYPFEIVVRPQHVAFLYEWNWWARVAYLPGALSSSGSTPLPPGIGGGPPGGGPPGGGPPGGEPPGGGPAGFGAGPGVPGGPGGPPPGGPGGGPGSAVSLEIDPEPMGAADGKWTGNVFTIRTAHLLGTTLIDSAGMPHSDGMKLTEKLRLISPDVLEDRILFDDPATFTKPWETVVTYRRQNSTLRNDEDVCLDRIRDGQPAVKEVTP